jgi:ribosomal protein L21E
VFPNLFFSRNGPRHREANKARQLFRQGRELLYKKFRVYKSNAEFKEGESVIIEVTPSRISN